MTCSLRTIAHRTYGHDLYHTSPALFCRPADCTLLRPLHSPSMSLHVFPCLFLVSTYMQLIPLQWIVVRKVKWNHRLPSGKGWCILSSVTFQSYFRWKQTCKPT